MLSKKKQLIVHLKEEKKWEKISHENESNKILEAVFDLW